MQFRLCLVVAGYPSDLALAVPTGPFRSFRSCFLRLSASSIVTCCLDLDCPSFFPSSHDVEAEVAMPSSCVSRLEEAEAARVATASKKMMMKHQVLA